MGKSLAAKSINFLEWTLMENFVPVDWTRPFKTKGGRSARAICFDRKTGDSSLNTVVVLVVNEFYNVEEPFIYSIDGRRPNPSCFNSQMDLVNDKLYLYPIDSDIYTFYKVIAE